MSIAHEVDEFITVTETIEKGYFYLENRQFHGPFETEAAASTAALEHCQLSIPGECRAIYHGSAKRNNDTNLNEPMGGMRQTASVKCPVEAEQVQEEQNTVSTA